MFVIEYQYPSNNVILYLVKKEYQQNGYWTEISNSKLIAKFVNLETAIYFLYKSYIENNVIIENELESELIELAKKCIIQNSVEDEEASKEIITIKYIQGI